jgi:glycogen(starch) synthase
VSFGKLPLPHQTEWLRMLHEVDYRATEYRLEWMEVAERDIEESKRYLGLLVKEVRPDVLHFSQYCYGDLAVKAPKVIVAHSDVVSWWVAVHGKEPDDTPWMRRYREHVMNGLRAADFLVAPSRWMLNTLCEHYLCPQNNRMIHNGRTPGLFSPDSGKQAFALSVGRLWDAGKNMSVLLRQQLPGRVCIAGWEQEPGKDEHGSSLRVGDNIQLLGFRSQSELKTLFAHAGLYIATSRYEPFGLSPLEAALSRCALVMNDIPVFHELWEDAALYFRSNDPGDLAEIMAQLDQNPEMRRDYADRAYERAIERFTASRMVAEYERLYQDCCSLARTA